MATKAHLESNGGIVWISKTKGFGNLAIKGSYFVINMSINTQILKIHTFKAKLRWREFDRHDRGSGRCGR